MNICHVIFAVPDAKCGAFMREMVGQAKAMKTAFGAVLVDASPVMSLRYTENKPAKKPRAKAKAVRKKKNGHAGGKSASALILEAFGTEPGVAIHRSDLAKALKRGGYSPTSLADVLTKMIDSGALVRAQNRGCYMRVQS